MTDLVLSLPLNHDKVNRAIAVLGAPLHATRTQCVRIGQCALYRDLSNDLIWGVDCYGQDAIAAAGDDLDVFHRAVIWAVTQHRPERVHPAEFSH